MKERSPKTSPGESGSHAVDHTRVTTEEVRSFVITTALCTCGGTDHHWIRYTEDDQSWVEVQHF